MVNPFLAKFAHIAPVENDTVESTEPSQDGNEISQGKLVSTIFTKVDRETTDDQ